MSPSLVGRFFTTEPPGKLLLLLLFFLLLFYWSIVALQCCVSGRAALIGWPGVIWEVTLSLGSVCKERAKEPGGHLEGPSKRREQQNPGGQSMLGKIEQQKWLEPNQGKLFSTKCWGTCWRVLSRGVWSALCSRRTTLLCSSVQKWEGGFCSGACCGNPLETDVVMAWNSREGVKYRFF